MGIFDGVVVAPFYCGLTVLIFVLWIRVQKYTSWFFLNPFLMSLVSMMLILIVLNIPYGDYMRGGRFIILFMEPCVVALGYPLYKQLRAMGQRWRELMFMCIIASFLALTVCTLLSRLFGLEEWVIKSLVILCITTPIAMETSELMGGEPSLAALTVMIAGITGSAFGLQLLRLCRITNYKAIGMAIGSASHALGTATVARTSYESSAYASSALIICAIITAIVAPVYIPFLLSM